MRARGGRRALWVMALFGAALASCSEGVAMSDRETESMLTKLRACAQTGALAGLEIEVWTGGGQPPPYRRSDQLRALVADGRDVLEFAHPKHDVSFDPPDLVERFRLPAKPDDVRRFARLVLDTGVFARAQEPDPGGADGLVTEVTVTLEGQRFERRYSGTPPDFLGPLVTATEAWVARLQREGERALLHQGRVVSSEKRGQ